MTWQSLTQSLEEATEYVAYETAAEKKDVAMSAISCWIPELGTFLKMEDAALVDVLISMWDGQLETWGHKTKSSGNIEIKNPWLNLIGCTTPTWMSQHFSEAAIGGGLTSRIMFVYGESKRHLVAYPDEHENDANYYSYKKRLVADLQEIAMLSGPYNIDKEARQWGREWYEKLWSSRPIDMANDRYSPYISRKQTHMHKLAMVLAASQRSEMVIKREDLVQADKLLTSIEPHMIKVFESVGVIDQSRHIASILAYVKAYKWIDVNQLYGMLMNNIPQREFKEAITIAVSQKLLRVENRSGKSGLSYIDQGTLH